jgi:hypothetical protein
LFTGASSFHGRIERQDIGLECDAVDHADDVRDLVRRRIDLAHGVHHVRHCGAAALRHIGGGGREPAGLLSRFGALPDGAGQLLHRACGLLQVAGSGFGACAQILVAAGDLGAGGVDAAGAGAYLGNQFLQPGLGAREFAHQAGGDRRRGSGVGQVAIGNAAQGFTCMGGLAADLARNGARHQPGQAAGHADRQRCQHYCKHCHALRPCLRLLMRTARGLAAGVDLLDQLGAQVAPGRRLFGVEHFHRSGRISLEQGEHTGLLGRLHFAQGHETLQVAFEAGTGRGLQRVVVCLGIRALGSGEVLVGPAIGRVQHDVAQGLAHLQALGIHLGQPARHSLLGADVAVEFSLRTHQAPEAGA